MISIGSPSPTAHSQPVAQKSGDALRVRKLQEQVRQLRTATICALNQMLDMKEINTGTHATRLAEWALRVGEQFGMLASELRDLEAGAILHDIGKVGVAGTIFNKPGKLDAEERKQIK